MSELAKGSAGEPGEPLKDLPLLNDYVVRLETLADEAGTPLDNILLGASKGQVELLFERPPIHPRVVLRPRGNDRVTGEVNLLRTPDFLALQPGDCRQLLDRRVALVTHSGWGYRSRNDNTYLTRLNASEADKHAMFPVQVDGKDFHPFEQKYAFWGYWSLWSDAGAVQYAVRREDVFVRASELKRWRIEHYYLEMGWQAGVTPDPETSLLDDPNFNDDYKSPHLLLMCHAARYFWGNDKIVFDNPRTFPKNEEVATWLMDQAPDIFSKTSAEDAARFLKPRFAMHLVSNNAPPASK